MKNLYKVGDIVRVKKSFLGEPEGIRGYVYDEYNSGDDNSVLVVTENGVNLGSFSSTCDLIFDASDMNSEQIEFLTFLNYSGYKYEFKNVIQLDRDFNKLIKPLF